MCYYAHWSIFYQACLPIWVLLYSLVTVRLKNVRQDTEEGGTDMGGKEKWGVGEEE